MKIQTIFIILIFLLSFSLGCIEYREEEYTEKSMSVEEIKTNALHVSYNELMRHNENYIGKIVHFRGKVVQVLEKYQDNYILRVATKLERYGYYGNVIWVNYQGERLLEDDIIDIYGKVKGLRTYLTVLGSEVTIPEITALYVELIYEAGEHDL